jgi:hypothetical protein
VRVHNERPAFADPQHVNAVAAHARDR